MKNKDKVVCFENPAKSVVQDVLTGFIRESAQKMLATAIETKVSHFMEH